MDHNAQYRTALVLQGGGALGAYEYGVLKALYESRPQFHPAVVTGISIGAINAAVLVGAKEDPMRTLEDLWRHKFTSLQSYRPLSEDCQKRLKEYIDASAQVVVQSACPPDYVEKNTQVLSEEVIPAFCSPS